MRARTILTMRKTSSKSLKSQFIRHIYQQSLILDIVTIVRRLPSQ